MYREIKVIDYVIDNTVAEHTDIVLDLGINTDQITGILLYDYVLSVTEINPAEGFIRVEGNVLTDLIRTEKITLLQSTLNTGEFPVVRVREDAGDTLVYTNRTLRTELPLLVELVLKKKTPIIDYIPAKKQITVLGDVTGFLQPGANVMIEGNVKQVNTNVFTVESLITKPAEDVYAKSLFSAVRVTFNNLSLDCKNSIQVGSNLTVIVANNNTITPRAVIFDNESFGNYRSIWYYVPLGGILQVVCEMDINNLRWI